MSSAPNDPGRRILLRTEVNGKARESWILPETLLLDFLREELGLKGAKRSCDMEVCGACTVLVDGMAVSSCTMLAAEAEGRSVETIEELSDGQALHPLQKAFVEGLAFQCGFCTSGLIMGSLGMLRESPDPDEAAIRAHLKGHICRCTGYRRIIEAVQRAAKEMRVG